MRNSGLMLAILAGGAAAMLIGAVQIADAKAKPKPKPTYEEAWKLCTEQMDRSKILKQDAGQRYAAGGACMMKYGYRI